MLAIILLQWTAFGVLPIALNQERVTSVGHKDRSNFFERLDAAFNPARIYEQRQTCHLQIPKLLVNFEERKFHRFARVIHEFDMVVTVPAAHGAVEMNVKLEQVCGENVRRWINLSDNR